MEAEEIKILLDKVYRPVCKIEEDLGMPKTTLQKAIKGDRSLPKRWSMELKDYVKTSGWVAANVKENNKPENKARIEAERNTVSEASKKAINPLTDEYGQMGNSGEISRDTWKHTNIKIAGSSPKTLDELKALCPKDLKGFERSEWIAKERQKYNI